VLTSSAKRAASAAKRGLDGAAEDERWMRLLNGARARQRRLLSKLVRRPAVVERVLGPGPDDDLDLLGEQPKSLPRIEERKPVLDVLTLVPAGAHAHVDASSGDVVDGDRHPGEHARMPERRRRDERAESSAPACGRMIAV